jgi:integrase
VWKGGYLDKESALKALRKVLSQIDEGTYVPVSDQTLGEYLREWLEDQRAHVEPNTWVTYRNHVNYYLAPDDRQQAAYRRRTKSEDHPWGLEKPSLGEVRLQALTSQRASRHLAELLRRGKRDGVGLSPRTVKGIRITLNAAIASAKEAGHLARPVKVRPIAVPKRRPTIYTPTQTEEFLNVALRDRLVAMWALFVTSAMRPSEVLGLLWTAVDLDSTGDDAQDAEAVAAVSIYMKLIMVDGRAVLAEGTKTPGSEAPLMLVPWVRDLLQEWRKTQLEEQRLWPGPVVDNGLVFTWPNGDKLKPRWVARQFKKLASEAGLPAAVRLYDLRHGWATAALRAGVHPKLVQEVMRHRDYRTTAETYAHVMPAQSAQAVNAVAALFRRSGRDEEGRDAGAKTARPPR